MGCAKKKKRCFHFFRQAFPPRFLNSILFYAFPKQRPFSGALGRGWKTVAAALTNRRNIETTAWIPPRVIFLPYFASPFNCWRRITPSALVVGQLYCQMVSWTAVVHILSADQDMPSEAAQICSKYIFSNPIYILVSFTCTIPKASFVRCYLTGWRFKIILTDVFKVLPSM